MKTYFPKGKLVPKIPLPLKVVAPDTYRSNTFGFFDDYYNNPEVAKIEVGTH
jgi:hypothetical protein